MEFNNDLKYGNMTFRELRNRRALTGDSCTINKLIGVVGVGSWTKNLGALTDDSLDNYAQVNSVVRAGVTVDPIVSVKIWTITIPRERWQALPSWLVRVAAC